MALHIRQWFARFFPQTATRSNNTCRLGVTGEKAAARFLKRRGYRILARNYTCPLGELDLICADDKTIVFVEVKTRITDADADPEANVTYGKQRRMEKAARHWLAAHRQPQAAYRFDVVTVVMKPGEKPVIEHIMEALLPKR